MKRFFSKPLSLLAMFAFVLGLFLAPGAAFGEKEKDSPPKKKRTVKKRARPTPTPEENVEDVADDTNNETPDVTPDTSQVVDEEADPEKPLPPGAPGTVAKTQPVIELHIPGLDSTPSPAAKKDGGVYVNCPTPGAKVRIDGILKGSTNENVMVGPDGVYEIEVFAPGYITYKIQRKIPGGETVSFDATLQPMGGNPAAVGAVAAPVPAVPTAPEAVVSDKTKNQIAGAWRVEFNGSTKAILRKDSIVEIQQNGSAITLYADTYLPDRTMLSMKDWDLQTKYRWTGNFENHKLCVKAWKGQLQFDATISDDGTLFEGKVNSSVNRYHTFVNLRRL
ncbi:MAG: PEGA domain-containing protein [Candidatus Ozemobacteraceae bacterium]